MSSSMMKCGTTGFWITGEKSQSELEGIVKDEGIKSCLYLNPDTEDDTGCTPNGIASINQIFGEENTGHVPMTMGDFAFSVPKTIPDELEDNQRFIAAMRKYGDFARVLDRLERPTLIMCKSNRRAACVQAVYTAIQDGVGINQLIESNIQPWHGAPPMLTWATTVVTAYNRRRNEGLIFRQLFEKESSTYTYLLADPASKEAVLIDPVLETVDRDWKHVAELGLSLKYVINTHVHADHITGTGLLKQHSAAVVDAHNAKRKAILVDGAVSTEEEAKWKADKRECAMSAVARVSGAVADVQLDDGSHLSFGNRKLIVMSTPGHTAGCVSYLLDDGSRVFTGDALLIRGCGRTDFQEGSSSTLYESVTSKLFTLPSDTQVWPAHNYSGLTTSSIGEERSLNPRLACEMPAGPVSKTEFHTIMSELKLSYPKKIDIALPANLKCGV